MFNIDDNFLARVGYNVATLSEEKKAQYKQEMTEELNKRLPEAVLAQLSEEKALEFEDVSGNPARTRRWLAEFHSDFAEREDYKKLRAEFASDEEAMSFYASALWMRYDVPNFGEIAQQVINDYAEELVEMRNAVNQQLGIV